MGMKAGSLFSGVGGPTNPYITIEASSDAEAAEKIIQRSAKGRLP